MKFLFLESFYRGSHALFADGLVAASGHEIDLCTMPGDFWKWRMLSAALYFSETAPPIENYDGLVISDLFNLADFLAVTSTGNNRRIPVLAYFHENQITYPPPPGDKGAFQMGMINLTTALVADQVVFNSKFHKDVFLEAIPHFLAKGRDCRPESVLNNICAKSTVLYPGISIPADYLKRPASKKKPPHEPPLIIWNHRWSFDKNYPLFFEALNELREKGMAFRLALLGESYGRTPAEFEQARKIFGNDLYQFGFVNSRREYLGWLGRGDIVVSTAQQENFGISVIEAALCGCAPLLPDRLAYPEIIPADHHDACLYRDPKQLVEKLGILITDHERRKRLSEALRHDLTLFLWQNQIERYDQTLADLVGQRRSVAD
jgi:glycosyltransferase involved in cell wall biosynthesis